MMPGSVLFVDDDADLREVMEMALAQLGVPRVVSAASLDAVQAQRDHALACEVAILDINLGREQPSGVHVYGWLKDEGFRGRVIFLTGHASTDARVRDAADLADSRIATKPLSVADLAYLLGGRSRLPP